MTKWTVVQHASVRTVEAETALAAAQALVDEGAIQNPAPGHMQRIWVVPVDALTAITVFPGTPTVGR